MDHTLSDALAGAIASYLRFFESTSALGGALFGAALFLIARTVGFVSDDRIRPIERPVLVVWAGFLGLGLIACGFIAQNVATAFHVELLRPAAWEGCVFPADRKPETFFMECHRPTLVWLVIVDLIAAALACGCMAWWFVLQSRQAGRIAPPKGSG